MFAENIDNEIQRLENKPLELKQRNQQLSSDLETEKVTDNKIQKDLLKVKKNKAKDKNGFFLGVEVVLGSSYTRYMTEALYNSAFNYSNRSTTFDGGLLLGYQWYFGETQKHGLKLSSHLYSGFGRGYNKSNKTHVSIRDSGGYHLYADINHTLIPIKVGFDIKYLWDFLEKKNHILGLNVGLGYEFSYYFSNFNAKRSLFHKETPTLSRDIWEPTPSNLINQEIYPTIGLHYNYKHHQMELNYRFGGILRIHNSRTLLKEKAQEPDGLIVSDLARLRFLTQSYIALNYAYRF
ncbi:outer membrane beta-barrel protein [Helicobacter anatolicus]|uniref:outer membrane beta-barrel protein n=1 Tax=Helicobacter anatolicus TaxID=2905874 RepID=UPI001E2D024D|nr:outer membrane beta-barrel protein [Helicobacter anatolicus]MCE3039375.1 outer membrane beta-barrel protein [Helicobacter anatolicus]